jgi:hypothetical protein
VISNRTCIREPDPPDLSPDVLIRDLRAAALNPGETAEYRKQAEVLAQQLSGILGGKK